MSFASPFKESAVCQECGAKLPYNGAWCAHCGKVEEKLPRRVKRGLRQHQSDQEKHPKSRRGIPRKPTLFDLWRPTLKAQFLKAGVTACEIRLPGCDNFHLTFAHIDKRRFLTLYELLVMIVLGCLRCHTVVEGWPRETMRAHLVDIIEKRGWRPEMDPPD